MTDGARYLLYGLQLLIQQVATLFTTYLLFNCFCNRFLSTTHKKRLKVKFKQHQNLTHPPHLSPRKRKTPKTSDTWILLISISFFTNSSVSFKRLYTWSNNAVKSSLWIFKKMNSKVDAWWKTGMEINLFRNIILSGKISNYKAENWALQDQSPC